MKLKNIVVVATFIVSSLYTTIASSQSYTYTLSYSNNGTGTITFNTLTLAGAASTTALPSYVTGISLTLGGNTYAMTTSIVGMYLTPLGGAPSVTLNTNSGNQKSSLYDLNFFAAPSTCPFGQTYFTIGSCSTTYVLQGIYYGSATGSVNLAPNAYALRSAYNIQSSALNAGLSYDCTVFDKEGLCLSTGGRYSTTNSPNATSTSGLLIGSFKYDKNIRLGAWVDQNLSTNSADGIKLGNSKPLLGVFGVWSERNDGLGYEVKVSAGYGEKDITVTRTTDYQGSAKVNTKGLQSVSSYGIALDGDWIAAPYAGLKYVSISRGGYTEGGSSPLTYDTLRQETTSVVAGVKFTGKIDPQTFTVLSAGVEHDLNHNVGQYSAGSSNTTAFNSDVKKTRPVVSAGLYYDIDKTQRVGVNATHRQEAFQSTATTSALATYTVGF